MSCSGCAFKGMSTAVEDAFVGVRFREERLREACTPELFATAHALEQVRAARQQPSDVVGLPFEENLLDALFG